MISLLLIAMLAVFLAFTGLSHGEGVLPDNKYGEVGSRVTFTSTISPPDQPTVIWTFINDMGTPIRINLGEIIIPAYRDRITLNTSTASMELRDLTINDNGNYTLEISGLVGDAIETMRGSTILESFTLVSNAVITPDTKDYVEFNDTAVLTCSVASGSSLSYLWLNGSSEVMPSEGVQLGDRNSTLTIVNVTRYDQGPFRCRVFNPISSNTSEPVELNINFGPENTTVTVSPSKDYNEEESKLTLSCSAVSKPSALFHWFLNGYMFPLTGPEPTMNVQINQSGNYSCQAFNSKTLRYHMSEVSVVTVLEKISGAAITPSTIQLEEGTSTNMTCNAEGTIDRREWSKDGKPLIISSNVTLDDSNRVLRFSAVKKTDSGEYLCTLSNPISSAMARSNMMVYYGPYNVQINGDTELEEGQLLELTCSADSEPDPLYQWLHNGTVLDEYSLVGLLEKTVGFNDSGKYICIAKNNVTRKTAESSVHVSVKEEGSTRQPGGLSAGAIAAIVIVVLLVIGGTFGGGGYYLYKKGTFRSNGSSSGSDAGHNNRVCSEEEEVKYADVSQFRRKDGGRVPLGNLGTSPTEYAEVRANSRTGGGTSSPPTYDAHMHNVKSSAPQPGQLAGPQPVPRAASQAAGAGQPADGDSSVYSQVRK